MRLPLSKVYRAFPELDRFDDARCQAYVTTAIRRHRVLAVLLYVAMVVMPFVAWPVIWYNFLRGFSFIRFFGSDGRVLFELLSGVMCALLLGLVTRDLFLRSIVRKQLNRGICQSCEYQLLGLPVKAGAVTCPECGKRIQLASIGLTPEDILASKAE